MENVVLFPALQSDTPTQQAKSLVGLVAAQMVCDLANNGVDIKDPEVHNSMGTIMAELKSIAAHHYGVENDHGS